MNKSKVCIVALIIFNLSEQCMFAQQSGVYLGVNVGIQYSKILNEQDQNAGDSIITRATFKPIIGGDLGWQFSSNFGIQTGLLLSQQGQKYKRSSHIDSTFSTDLSYLKVPLVLTYKTATEKIVSLVIMAGAQLNFLYRAESSRRNVFGSYTKSALNVEKYYEKMPLEFVFGLGAQYNISEKINLFTILRADYSTNTIEVPELRQAERTISRNLTIITPMFGIHFYL
jgi:hypothetical protein